MVQDPIIAVERAEEAHLEFGLGFGIDDLRDPTCLF
jgi:hypothetical protein